MSNKVMSHELDQLASMFCQLGNAAAQIVSGHGPMANEDQELAVTAPHERAKGTCDETESEVVLQVV